MITDGEREEESETSGISGDLACKKGKKSKQKGKFKNEKFTVKLKYIHPVITPFDNVKMKRSYQRKRTKNMRMLPELDTLKRIFAQNENSVYTEEDEERLKEQLNRYKPTFPEIPEFVNAKCQGGKKKSKGGKKKSKVEFVPRYVQRKYPKNPVRSSRKCQNQRSGYQGGPGVNRKQEIILRLQGKVQCGFLQIEEIC